MIRIVVDTASIDLGDEFDRLETFDVGALATFTGLVRTDDGVTELALEHYPGATEAALGAIAAEAQARWGLTAVTIVHRVGAMRARERIVFTAAAAPHRAAALEACAFLIDRLKTDAPFWKRERRGTESRWVDARSTDHAAAERWR